MCEAWRGTAMADSAERRNLWPEHPDYRVDFVPTEKRVRGVHAGTTIVDSTNARLMLETGHTPVYYFPASEVRLDLLSPNSSSTFCPFKGEASYWDLSVGGQHLKDAVWSYREPFPETRSIQGWLAFYWNALEHWYEEDDEVFVHPRNPYVRIDVRQTSRPVRVLAGGATVAESTRARLLFETGHPTRFYLPPEDVRTDLLRPSQTTSGCPYKGFARYWSLELEGASWPDLVWSYPTPFDEVRRVADYLCFYEERCDAVELDGERRARPSAPTR